MKVLDQTAQLSQWLVLQNMISYFPSNRQATCIGITAYGASRPVLKDANEANHRVPRNDFRRVTISEAHCTECFLVLADHPVRFATLNSTLQIPAFVYRPPPADHNHLHAAIITTGVGQKPRGARKPLATADKADPSLHNCHSRKARRFSTRTSTPQSLMQRGSPSTQDTNNSGVPHDKPHPNSRPGHAGLESAL